MEAGLIGSPQSWQMCLMASAISHFRREEVFEGLLQCEGEQEPRGAVRQHAPALGGVDRPRVDSGGGGELLPGEPSRLTRGLQGRPPCRRRLCGASGGNSHN